MSNPTPSEIAEWLEGLAGSQRAAARNVALAGARGQEHFESLAEGSEQAAVTIRELEAQNERLIHKLGVERKHGEQQSAKLKIATQALDTARMASSEYGVIVPINEALARMKEVG